MCGYASLISGRLLKPALSKEERDKRGKGGGGERRGERKREPGKRKRREGKGSRDKRGERQREIKRKGVGMGGDDCRQVPGALQNSCVS